jgi:hypothetical protein
MDSYDGKCTWLKIGLTNKNNKTSNRYQRDSPVTNLKIQFFYSERIHRITDKASIHITPCVFTLMFQFPFNSMKRDKILLTEFAVDVCCSCSTASWLQQIIYNSRTNNKYQIDAMMWTPYLGTTHNISHFIRFLCTGDNLTTRTTQQYFGPHRLCVHFRTYWEILDFNHYYVSARFDVRSILTSASC